MDLTNFNLRITGEMKERIEESAKQRGLTQNAVIVFALEHYFMQAQVLPQLESIMKESQEQRKNE